MSQPNLERAIAQAAYKYNRWYWQVEKELQMFGCSVEWFPIVDFPSLYARVSDPGDVALLLVFGLQWSELPRAVA